MSTSKYLEVNSKECLRSALERVEPKYTIKTSSDKLTDKLRKMFPCRNIMTYQMRAPLDPWQPRHKEDVVVVALDRELARIAPELLEEASMGVVVNVIILKKKRGALFCNI